MVLGPLKVSASIKMTEDIFKAFTNNINLWIEWYSSYLDNKENEQPCFLLSQVSMIHIIPSVQESYQSLSAVK